MRLRTISPPLTDELLEALEACKIKTDVELLFTMTPMEIYRKISPTSIPLADLIAEVDRVAAIAAAPAICAEDILEREATRHDAPSTEYSSGIPELDGLVAGFAGPKLIEVSGDKGSCKTVRLNRHFHIYLLKKSSSLRCKLPSAVYLAAQTTTPYG